MHNAVDNNKLFENLTIRLRSHEIDYLIIHSDFGFTF